MQKKSRIVKRVTSPSFEKKKLGYKIPLNILKKQYFPPSI